MAPVSSLTENVSRHGDSADFTSESAPSAEMMSVHLAEVHLGETLYPYKQPAHSQYLYTCMFLHMFWCVGREIKRKRGEKKREREGEKEKERERESSFINIVPNHRALTRPASIPHHCLRRARRRRSNPIASWTSAEREAPSLYQAPEASRTAGRRRRQLGRNGSARLGSERNAPAERLRAGEAARLPAPGSAPRVARAR